MRVCTYGIGRVDLYRDFGPWSFLQAYGRPLYPIFAWRIPKVVCPLLFQSTAKRCSRIFFGDPQIKTTWLWLKNLPLLVPTNLLPKPEPLKVDDTPRKKKRCYTDAATRDPKQRAKFWPGIAEAMAVQWTEYLTNQ